MSDLGTYYQRSNQTAQALHYFERAIAADARNFRAFGNRASIRLSQDRAMDALHDADQALKLRPEYITARINRAVASYKLGDTADALRRFAEILERAPNFTGARASRATIYYQCRRWKERWRYEQIVSEAPEEGPRFRPIIDDCRARLGR